MISDIKKVNLAEKFELFTDYWNPHIVGDLNGQQVKLAKFEGPFIWHEHANEDELFLVITGKLTMELENKTIEIYPGEFVIIPRGTQHRPVANEEVQVLLFEPATTLNTGGKKSKLTRHKLKKI